MARKKKFSLISLRKKRRWRPRKKSYFKLFFVLFLVFMIVPLTIWYVWFKKHILDTLPPVSNIENIVFSQTTTIVDRNWVVLYKLFNENRKYEKLNDISVNMQNAIIATEDKNFWKNPWIDIQWIIRAWFHDIFLGKKQWASTLTQQLIKNLLLTREKTIIRKLKEIVLSLKLNKYLENKIKKQNPWLTDKETKELMKKQILEMYLNYIFLWNNSYWVEAASKTYFKKDASSLTILESAILASIPKSPTKYDPVKNRNNNLWQLEAIWTSWEKISLNSDLWKLVKEAYIWYLEWQTFSLLKNEWDIIDMISNKNLKYKNIKINYIPWRKDFVLSRMYIDGYIDKNQFIEAIKEWFDEKIYWLHITIKAPHFVFNVINQLEEKYGKALIEKAWWTIKTSLDYKIQKLAEKSVSNWTWYLLKKWADNTALVYLDSKNWDILAYVGSENYNNKKIDWQVDMLTSKRQCGSVIKPFIYSKWFIENPKFTPGSPIYDTKFNIAEKWNTFNNFDWRFLWLLPIKKALPYSRNIPASKMYYLGGWEQKVKSFLQNIGLTNISNKIYYWYPLSIWAVEVKPINFAQALINLSNIDQPVKINPILEIKWPDGSIIYEKKVKKLKTIIPKYVVSYLWYILSNPLNLPAWWRNEESIKWLALATKSWTTNIKLKNWKKLPRDGWLISYSPSRVFVAWAWNTKWEPMHGDAYGGWTAWKIWKDFMLSLKKNWYLKNENMVLKWTTEIYINSINWKKSSWKTPIQISKKTIANINNLPKEDDGTNVQMIKVDTLCNWLVSKYTPKNSIKTAYIIQTTSLNPFNLKWEKPVQDWWKYVWTWKYSKIFQAPVLLKAPTKICEDRLVIAQKWMLDFGIDYPKSNQNLTYVFDLWLNIKNTPFKIKNVNVFLDNKLIKKYDYKGNPIITVYLKNTVRLWKHKLQVVIEDEKWYTKQQILNFNLVEKDKDKPFLKEIKQINWKYAYIFQDKTSKVLWWFLICNWKKIRFNWSIWIWNSPDCKSEMVLDYYGN